MAGASERAANEQISPLEIDDTNTGDYGRPFGTYAALVRSAAKRYLEAQGQKPHPKFGFAFYIDELYVRHMNSLPSYRTISQRRLQVADSENSENSTIFTEPELRAIYERFAMDNHPDHQKLCNKIANMLTLLGAL